MTQKRTVQYFYVLLILIEREGIPPSLFLIYLGPHMITLDVCSCSPLAQLQSAATIVDRFQLHVLQKPGYHTSETNKLCHSFKPKATRVCVATDISSCCIHDSGTSTTKTSTSDDASPYASRQLFCRCRLAATFPYVLKSAPTYRHNSDASA